MTMQGVFDTVVRHLREQGAKSIRSDAKGCGYRGIGGMACAVGCLIDDDVYDPRMEGSVLYALFDTYPSLSHLKEYGPILAPLQRLHDMSSVIAWEAGFERIAERFRLIYSPQ